MTESIRHPRFHALANRVAAGLLKLLFGCVAQVRVLRRENANQPGGYLLAANHISHFDPFIISSVVRRKIDWMAMAEFFPYPVLGQLLWAVDAFPADRDRADRKTIRTAIERLKNGRTIGLFPEGGIRHGPRSLLEGAPLRPGASTLARIAGRPILPCVILGSDRLYAWRRWLPFRRTPIWIAFGDLIPPRPELDRMAARNRIAHDLAVAFKTLYSEIQQTFRLRPDDLPHSPQERMGKTANVVGHKSKERVSSGHSDLREGKPNAAGASGDETFPLPSRDPSTPLRSARDDRFRCFAAKTVDGMMCASINLLQSRHRLSAKSRDEMERYVIACQKLTIDDYYSAPAAPDLARSIGNQSVVTWQSPIRTRFAANNFARVDCFPSSRGWSGPTVLMLHALLSATHIGYRRWAAHFNALGWNACFVHLPYHYSRVPRGYWNGELAITADLVRNAEGLRQGVAELRQLLGALRQQGCSEFGILGTSYGAWLGALLACVETDLRFVALMAPIVNVEHAIWQSPAALFIRRELRRVQIEPSLVARHFHLSSPLHNQPLVGADRVLFVAGEYDLIARSSDIEAIQQKWRGSELLRVRQGHFGYRMMRETVARLKQRGL